MIFIGDDWAEDHHDVYLMDEAGQRLASRRLPEGLTGIRGLHELVAGHAEEPTEVVVGIETDRGPWVGALSAAGYQVYAINPMAVAPYPRPPPRLGRQIRCLRCQTAGRAGTHRPAQPPPDRRRKPQAEAIKVRCRYNTRGRSLATSNDQPIDSTTPRTHSNVSATAGSSSKLAGFTSMTTGPSSVSNR